MARNTKVLPQNISNVQFRGEHVLWDTLDTGSSQYHRRDQFLFNSKSETHYTDLLNTPEFFFQKAIDYRISLYIRSNFLFYRAVIFGFFFL